MRNLIKNTLVFLCVLNSIFCFAQKSTITNVDTTYLRPQWMSLPLSVNQFRNGKEIHHEQNQYVFFKVGKPSYFTKFVNGREQYYYNHNAIKVMNEGDTIVPFGFKVASSFDIARYQDLYNNPIINKNRSNTSNEIISQPSVVPSTDFKLQFNGFLMEGFFLDKSEFYVWLPQKELGSESSLAMKFEKSNNGDIKIDSETQYYGNGFQILCIENLEEKARDSVFEYKKILPNSYSDLVDDFFSIIKKQDKITVNANFTISGSIISNKQGVVVSNIGNLDLSSLNEKQIKPLLVQRINEVKVVPYYHGIELSAASNFKIFISKEVNSLPENYFSIMALKSYRNVEHKHVNFAQYNDFKSTMRSFSYRVEDDEELLYTEKSMYVEKFNSKGPIYSLASVLPGLGLRSIAKGNLEDKFFLRRGLLISSISLGGIAIASKLYSIYRYNLYRKDVYTSYATKNYNQANLSQKVFIASGLAYCVLGAIDFTWTFSIGCKNKYVERQLNKAIISDPTSLVVK